MFGGHLHKNESFIKAAKREFFEETNLKINSCKFFLELKFSFKRVSYMKKFYHYKLDKAWKKYFIFREGESFELISKKQLMRKNLFPSIFVQYYIIIAIKTINYEYLCSIFFKKKLSREILVSEKNETIQNALNKVFLVTS